ncbi:phospholipase C/P1 nuclease, partial [Lepidopterella palustris CBS 459.81]
MRSANLFFLLSAAQGVYSWGDLGHRTVAYLAQKYLTNDGAQLVSNLLGGEDISDAALWADTIKRRHGYTFTAEWHYIDAKDDPPTTCGVKYSRDCKANPGCVVSAIANMTGRVNDASLDADQQTEALKYIIHFIGDIHQPLHTEAMDRGGNGIPVCFDSRCSHTNLHGIWDKEILHKRIGLKESAKDAEIQPAAAKWADALFSGNSATGLTTVDECTDVSAAQTCALAWATEANAYICSYVLKNGADWLEQNDLGGDYFDGAAPIVDDMISKAGIRLGAWLNALAAARFSALPLVVQNEEL